MTHLYRKAAGQAVLCPVCKEMMRDYLAENGVCRARAGINYLKRSAKVLRRI
jgi:hypothetical protein